MSEEFFQIAQNLVMFWPALLAAAGLIALRGRRRRKNAFRRLRRWLLVPWLVLLPAWVMAWFGPQPAPTLLPEPVNSLLFWGGLVVLLVWELAPAVKQWRHLFRLTYVQRLRQIQAIEALNLLTPVEFELLVQDTYRRLGYSARHKGQSGDHGVDLEVHTPEGEYWVVQCKRWRGSLGEAAVRELFGTLLHEGADRAVLVTSAEITLPAQEWARGKPIDLIDGQAFLRMLERARRQSQAPFLQRMARDLAARFNPQSPPPTCPRCRAAMVQRKQRPGDRSRRKTFRCSNYPNCRVVVVRHS